ncbi:MAG: extracellular solute-binding protein [Kutzneria sp.]|nr:extracellular solute-binding protein [Kutzneria sp.]
MVITGKRCRLAAVLVMVAGVCLGACSDGAGTTASDFSGPTKGEHITVVLPSYSKLSDEMLARFQRETGVSVSINLASWDEIHSRIGTAGIAEEAIGDVTEVDWSWIGQLTASGWYEPLDTALDRAVRDDLRDNGAFTHDGHRYAACYSNDARIGVYNSEMFAEAGIAHPPATFEELASDLARIKALRVSEYPMALTLSATQGAATEWELLMVSMGGRLVDDSGRAAFRGSESAGYKALRFEVDAIKNGLAEPGSVSNNDQRTDALLSSGRTAVQLAGYPGELTALNDPKQSTVLNQTAYFLEPGINGPGATFGLPEGLGIPVASRHKAAAAVFINWMMRPDNQRALFAATGQMPCGASAASALLASGTVAGGPVIQQQLARSVPLFANGCPGWFPSFTNEVAADVNAAATGNATVDEAIGRMADKLDQLANEQ